MGHDIVGRNKDGDEICYIRFGAYEISSYLFYELLDAKKYHAGASGSLNWDTFSLLQVENALQSYYELTEDDFFGYSKEYIKFIKEEMLNFIKSCLNAAQKEKEVKIFFS